MRDRGRLLLLSMLAVALGGCGGGGKEGSAVLLPVPDDPTVTFMAWFKVGSENDPPGKEGLAYLTGQMIADASTTNNSYQEILQKLYPLASSYDVRVDREMSTLSGRTHRDNIDTYFDLFSDAYLRPAFDEEDFERIKTNTVNYLEKVLRYSSDEELGKAALYWFVFEGTPWAHPERGTVQGLRSITLDDIREFYANHYTRDNAVLALGGGYEEGLVSRFERSRGELLPGRPALVPAPTPAPIDGTRVLLVSKPGADASISFGFPIDVRRGDPDFYALWVANSWLGEHRNSFSHLYQVIRAERGLNYGDYSYIEIFPEGGSRNVPPTNVARRRQIFEVWIRTLPNDKAHFALRAAVRELGKLVENGMTAEQFELTRSFLKKYSLHFAETTARRLGYAVDDRFYGIPDPGFLVEFRRRMDELTLEDVNAAIKKHLRYDNLKIAMVTGEAEAMKQALVSDAPSPLDESGKPESVLREDRQIAVFPLGIEADHVRIVPVEEMFEK